MNKKLIGWYIEEIILGLLILYFIFYYFLSLYDKHLIFNYILVLMMGVFIGCKIMKMIFRYFYPDSNLWKYKK